MKFAGVGRLNSDCLCQFFLNPTLMWPIFSREIVRSRSHDSNLSAKREKTRATRIRLSRRHVGLNCIMRSCWLAGVLEEFSPNSVSWRRRATISRLPSQQLGVARTREHLSCCRSTSINISPTPTGFTPPPHQDDNVRPHISTPLRRGFSNCAIHISSWLPLVYSAPDRGAEYCDDRVCLFVCPRHHISATTSPSFTNFCAYYLRPVLLWRRCDMLYTSVMLWRYVCT